MLERFVELGKLRAFIDKRPEFVIVQNSHNKGFTFEWSPDFSPGGSSSHGTLSQANATFDIEAEHRRRQCALASGRMPLPPVVEDVASLTWLVPDIEVNSIMEVKTPGYIGEADGYISVKGDDRVIIKCLPATGDPGYSFSSYVYVRLASAPTECGGWMPVELLAE